MARGVRKSITIPGLLAPTVKRRCAEFGHSIFTPYAVELVCYDLRSDAKHSITLEIARDTQTAQDAVDRELVAQARDFDGSDAEVLNIASRQLCAAIAVMDRTPPRRKPSEARVERPLKQELRRAQTRD